jgi:FkbM family methyltransferase
VSSLRFRRNNVLSIPIGDNLHAVFPDKANGPQILETNELALLQSCESFGTLQEHAREWLFAKLISSAPAPIRKLLSWLRANGNQDNALSHSQREHAESQLNSLLNRGYLLSEQDILETSMFRSRLNGSSTSIVQIGSVGILTRHRPESLKSCIDSYIRHAQTHCRSVCFDVMDDSTDMDMLTNNRQALSSLADQHTTTILYADHEHKTHFVQTLVKRYDLPTDVVSFALFDTERCGYTGGANGNALLLHTAGNATLSSDDDMICGPASLPECTDGLMFDTGNAWMQYWFFPDRDSAVQSVKANSSCDLLTAHERLLGKTLTECISATAPGRVRFGLINNSLFQGLRSGEGRVTVTFPGLVGDSGAHTPLGLLFLHGASRERLLQSDSLYRSACRSREVLRAVNQPTITHSSWFMSGTVGLDNRELLPPFMPVMRNYDGVFGALLNKCFMHSFQGHLPQTVLHNPPDKRRFEPGAVSNSLSQLRLSDLVIACVNSFQPNPGVKQSSKQLRILGQYLTDLASLPSQEFEEYLRFWVWHMQSVRMADLEKQLEVTRRAPKAWQSDIVNCLHHTREALLRKDYLVPQDIRNSSGLKERTRTSQRLVYRLGQLFFWWPDIVTAAKELRAEGCAMARPIREVVNKSGTFNGTNQSRISMASAHASRNVTLPSATQVSDRNIDSLHGSLREMESMSRFCSASDRSSKLRIGSFANFQIAHREGTADEAVIAHSFDRDIYFAGVPEYRPSIGDVIIDIGAHIGTFSLLASSKVPAGRVYAVEASEDSYNLLRMNVALNSASNVSVHHLAIMDRRGSVTLYHDSGNWGHSVVKKLSRGSEGVPACSLSEFLEDNNIRFCDFIKLNCEGAEFPILLRADPKVLRRFGVILVLYHGDLWERNSSQDVVDHLVMSGFQCYVRNQSETRGWIIAVNEEELRGDSTSVRAVGPRQRVC